jgi:signal transduction histidine kinase
LGELRQINIELDHRVEDRTRELSDALNREMAEVGKNQAILEGMSSGVIMLDAQKRTMVVNSAMGRLVNVPLSSLLNVPIDKILHTGGVAPLDRESILAMLQKPDKDIPSIRFRWGERTLLVNAAPVRTRLGDEIGTVVVFRDFTHEAEVEQMKNTFVAMVSHELRTPLSAILGYAEMMREAVYGVLNARQVGVMERIETSSKRLLSMISDLLDQAQLEAGRMSISESEFQTSDLVDTLHAMMGKGFKDKGIALNVSLDAQMPSTLRGDVHRLQQILLNLVGNAVKFTEKGEVNVRIFRANPDSWGMEVTDTGAGIPPEAQPYIFESFRQADNVITRQHGGIGLGLAIVHNLVQIFGGKITLKSKVGEGSTFTVILPFQFSKDEK